MTYEGTETWPDTPAGTDIFAEDLLAGEVALVTGGGTGIGEEVAVAYAELGADVAIASRDMDHLAPVADRIKSAGANACATTVDVRDEDRVETMAEEVTEELGDITVLVNNAGANFVTPTESLSANGWRSVVGTILDGTAYCSMAVGERMIDHGEGGSIISMGATNSVNGAPYHAHSGAGKAGVHNLMQTLGAEWAKFGIRANTIAPGIIETEGIAGAVGGELPEMLLDEIHADRFGAPADCVPLAVFLASPASNYVTGAYYTVDGGHLLPNVPF
jgi:NAD(P)-dependent dehydrogenase (short-subunit alcohol dehydrogenase family)